MRRGTARTATGRSFRATPASPHRRETFAPANPRFPAATTATRASLPRPDAAEGRWPASTASGDELAPTRPDPPDTPDNDDAHHYGPPPATHSTAPDPTELRSSGTTHRRRDRARPPPVPPTRTATETVPVPAAVPARAGGSDGIRPAAPPPP